MPLNDDDRDMEVTSRSILVPHWEAAIDGKPFTTVTAGDRETARERAARHRFGVTASPQQVQRVTVRYLCNK